MPPRIVFVGAHLVVSLVLAHDVVLAETRVRWGAEIHVESADERATRFDAAPHWGALLGDLACHRSQMKPATIEAFARVPGNERAVWLLRTRRTP